MPMLTMFPVVRRASAKARIRGALRFVQDKEGLLHCPASEFAWMREPAGRRTRVIFIIKAVAAGGDFRTSAVERSL